MKVSKEEYEKKRIKRVKEMETYTNVYKGEFLEDKRQGWGINLLRNGDVYKGQYQNDQMEGRGIYYFTGSSVGTSMLYVGEVKSNTF